MTRINIGVPVETLHDKHLRAEHRELKRIPNVIKKGRYNMIGQPEEFTLGKGHVKFFYDKLRYLHRRWDALHAECIKRGFNVTDFSESFQDLPPELYNDYQPTDRDRAIVQARIDERLAQMNGNLN